MDGNNGEAHYINSFALVAYLPDSVAGFLDRLRSELDPECHAKAHVTILPPRPLVCTAQEAWDELKQGLGDFQAFTVELGDIQIFPETDVVHVSIDLGNKELRRMHAALNRGRLRYTEPYEYEPHVTLAQGLDPTRVKAAEELASTRWNEFPGSRSFTVDLMTFVQNTIENRWKDRAGCLLSSHSNISI